MRNDAITLPCLMRIVDLPSRKQLRETLPLCLVFTIFFAGTYALTDMIASLHAWRFSFQLSWDRATPFHPFMAVFYLSIGPLLMCAPFVFRTREALMPLFRTLCAEVIIAAPFFLFLPDGEPLNHATDASRFMPMFRFADFINLRFNAFPSLHVAFAVTAAAAFALRCGPFGRTLFIGWSALIVLSTLLIHAHSILDVAGGLALALVAFFAVFIRTSPEGTQ